MSKGQVILITAIFLIIIVIAIRIEFDSVSSLQSQEFQRGVAPIGVFANIRDETLTTAKLAFSEDHIASYTDTKLAAYFRFVRGYDNAQAVYSVAGYRPPDAFTVRVGNFLDEDLTSVIVKHNLTGSVTTTNIGDITIGNSGSAAATSTVTSASVVQVNITYTKKYSADETTVSYLTQAGPLQNYTSTFSRLTLESEGSSYTDAVILRLAYNRSAGRQSGECPLCNLGGGSCILLLNCNEV